MTDDEIKKQFIKFYSETEATLSRGTVRLSQNSKEFFEEIEKHRYSIYPYFRELMEFDKYNGKNVLEIGVGEGIDHSQFARFGATVYGIDLTPRHVNITKNRFKYLNLKTNLHIADAENLPFPDNLFDLVYSCGVLFLIPNIQKAIDEIYRVLKPNGKVIALFYNRNSFNYYLNIIIYQGIIKGELRFLTFNKLKDWHAGDGFDYPPIKYFNKKELRYLFKKFCKHEFYIRTLGSMPIINRLFTEEMKRFYEKYFGYYLIIKTNK